MADKGVIANAVRVMRTATGELSKRAAEIGKNGGKARAASLSPERRAEIARKAAQARWQKAKQT